MAKLKCTAHGRRVMILETDSQWIHRNDGSNCDSVNATIGRGKITRGQEEFE
jgi:hypothetical protein